MKMDLHAHRLGACSSAIMSTALALILTGCGDQFGSRSKLEQSSDACSASAVSHQYVINFKNGESRVVRADSDDDLIASYLEPLEADIAFAEPDYHVREQRGPMWINKKISTTADNWGPVSIGADQLWQAGVRGDGITVAVIDSGMDLSHPQLAGRLLHDGDAGYDFIHTRSLAGDFAKHGTHVAGIIAAEHDDTSAGPSAHVEGVAPRANLLPLAFLNSDGLGVMSNAVRALGYAVKRGARVVNASWGGEQCSRSLREAIRGLENQNVFFVTAAGNAAYRRPASNIEMIPEYPASLNLFAMLTVGAVDVLGNVAEFSNYGPNAVHLFAPGDSIVSTLPGNQMGPLNGTSMAAPFVSGAVALLLSAEPSATVPQVRRALYSSASTRGEYQNASKGRLNLRTTLTTLRQLMSH